MDLFSDISNFIGTEDLSSETCQMYLDVPAGSTYDHSDVLVPNVDCETLNEIIKKFKSCRPEDLGGEQFICSYPQNCVEDWNEDIMKT